MFEIPTSRFLSPCFSSQNALMAVPCLVSMFLPTSLCMSLLSLLSLHSFSFLCLTYLFFRLSVPLFLNRFFLSYSFWLYLYISFSLPPYIYMHFCLSRNYSLSLWTPISLTLSIYKCNFIPLILFFSAHLSSFTFIMLWGFKHIFNYLLGFSNPLEFRKIFICYHFMDLLCLHIVLTRPSFSHSLIHFSFEVEVDGICHDSEISFWIRTWVFVFKDKSSFAIARSGLRCKTFEAIKRRNKMWSSFAIASSGERIEAE